MVSKELIQENKQKLLAEKKRLEDLLGRIASPNPDVEGDYEATYPDFGDDEDENASEVAEYAERRAEEQDLEVTLKKVNGALERIESESYGICKAGGEKISADRLRAVPEAEYCVEHSNE